MDVSPRTLHARLPLARYAWTALMRFALRRQYLIASGNLCTQKPSCKRTNRRRAAKEKKWAACASGKRTRLLTFWTGCLLFSIAVTPVPLRGTLPHAQRPHSPSWRTRCCALPLACWARRHRQPMASTGETDGMRTSCDAPLHSPPLPTCGTPRTRAARNSRKQRHQPGRRFNAEQTCWQHIIEQHAWRNHAFRSLWPNTTLLTFRRKKLEQHAACDVSATRYYSPFPTPPATFRRAYTPLLFSGATPLFGSARTRRDSLVAGRGLLLAYTFPLTSLSSRAAPHCLRALAPPAIPSSLASPPFLTPAHCHLPYHHRTTYHKLRHLHTLYPTPLHWATPWLLGRRMVLDTLAFPTPAPFPTPFTRCTHGIAHATVHALRCTWHLP